MNIAVPINNTNLLCPDIPLWMNRPVAGKSVRKMSQKQESSGFYQVVLFQFSGIIYHNGNGFSL